MVEGSIGLSTQESDPAIPQETVGPGAVTGERALLSGHPRGATMTAQESSIVATLSRADFDPLRSSTDIVNFRKQISFLRAALMGKI